MEIRINSKLESIRELMAELCIANSDRFIVIDRPARYNIKEEMYEGHHRIYLEDEDFPESSAKISYNPSFSYAKLTTAWSSYTYELRQRDGYVEIIYNGAYKGFMSQNLLPNLGELDYDTATVGSSLTKNRQTPLREYFMIREEMPAPQYGHKHPYNLYKHFAVNAE